MFESVLTFFIVGVFLWTFIRFVIKSPPKHWYIEVPTAHQLHPNELMFRILCRPEDYGFTIVFRLVKGAKRRSKVSIDSTGENSVIIFVINDTDSLNVQLTDLMQELSKTDYIEECHALDNIFRFVLSHSPDQWVGDRYFIISKIAQIKLKQLFEATKP